MAKRTRGDGAGARAPGIGDRWMHGERIDGVAFALHDRVVVVAGAHAGAAGRVLLLAAPPPAAAYLVDLPGGERPARVAQGDLLRDDSAA